MADDKITPGKANREETQQLIDEESKPILMVTSENDDANIAAVSQSLPVNFSEDKSDNDDDSEKHVKNSHLVVICTDNDDRLSVGKGSGLESGNGANVDDKVEFRNGNGEENAELFASWNTPGPSRVRMRDRKYVRSRSLGARSPADEGLTGADIRLLRERLLRTQPLPQPATLRRFTASQRLILVALVIVDFMSFCSMSIMAPFFPREAGEKGMSEAVSGFVFSFYALVMFVTSPMFGKILPSVGTKFLFLSGMFVAGSCNLLFGVLEYIYDYERFVLFCFLIRGLEALGASAYSTASYVYVVNTFPNHIGSVLGILETFVGLGMSVGPAIGGLLYSVGGFGLPFYVLGVAMVLTMPIIYFLLPAQEGSALGTKSGSLLELVKVPSVVITGLVIVVVSNTWAFLDPTLEPHLRQFNLSAEQVGLIFLLFSALYGLFSPIWGWLADRITRHWCMMVWGLFFCTFGLLLLGPSPLLPFLKSSLWLNLVALSIIGVSVALTLLPTFQGVLTSSIEEGGCSDSIATYSVVAGVWSCMYSLGEVIGPSLGGLLLRHYGFPVCSTVMAALTFTLAIITLSFFVLRETTKLNGSESISGSTEPWTSSTGRTLSADEAPAGGSETSPLLGAPTKESKKVQKSQGYGGTDAIDNSLKSDYVPQQCKITDDQDSSKEHFKLKDLFISSSARNAKLEAKKEAAKKEGLRALLQSDFYQRYMDGDIKSSDDEEEVLAFKDESFETKEVDDCGNVEDVRYKKDDSGLLPKLCDSLLSKHLVEVSHSRKNSMDLLQYNVDKVKYYGQSRRDDCEDLVLDRDQVTDVRGTVNITSSGACEV